MTIDTVLLDVAPEVANYADSTKRARFIGYATAQVKFGSGERKDLAIAYLAAHMLTMSNRAGNAGQVTSEKEGELSRSYGGSGDTQGLGATGYGQEFLRLQRQMIFAARTRNPG